MEEEEEEEEGARHGARPKLDPGGGGDLISALPEDLLLQVLVRLRCARAAARTGLLSRRWRGLWARLPDLTFRDVALGSLLPALASLQAPAGVSFLDILIAGHAQEAARVSSLLRAAAGLSPVEFHLALPRNLEFLDVDLPRFHRTTSIELHAHYLRLTLPPRTAGFPALQRLCLSGCRVDLADLVSRCPRLRVLTVAKGLLDSNITIKSESLEELAAANLSRWTGCIDVDAPMLKKLPLSFSIHDELSVSIVAPIVDKVSWECIYSRLTVGLDPWSLSSVSLHAAEVLGEDDTCLQQHSKVLSLQMWACGLTSYPDAELTFEQEIEKHLVTSAFSVLELHFMTMEFDCHIRSVGHVFGSFVLHLLGMNRIRTATQKLKIIFKRPEVKEECPVNCPCDEPKNWRSKDISLINLEQVEIEGLEGEDHEFDFLKVIFRCAPMLKRMAVRMPDEVRTSNDQCLKIYDIFRAYPSVECNVDRSCGSLRNS